MLENSPALRPMEPFIQAGDAAGATAIDGTLRGTGSSYRDHGYGAFFYALARCLRPRCCVELGVLQGFSLLAVACALRDNRAGRIDGFDLFEDYPYTSEPYANVVERIRSAGLQDWSAAHRAEAGEVADVFDTVDYLHVDLSNDGDRYREIFERWSAKVTQVIVLEGGSKARDEVGWMLRYRRPPIAAAVSELRRRYTDWGITVLDPYPSMTVAVRAPLTSGRSAGSRTMESEPDHDS